MKRILNRHRSIWILLLTLPLCACFQDAKTPEQLAREALELAEGLMAENKPGAAAQALYPVALRDDGLSERARAMLSDALSDDALRSAPREELAPLIRRAAMLETTQRGPTPDLLARVTRLARARASEAPLVVEGLLREVRFLADETNYKALDQLRLDILRQEPDSVEAAILLGQVYEDSSDVDSARAVLSPYRDRLADSEGARILGQLDYYAGDAASARPLLEAYSARAIAKLRTDYDAHIQRYDELVENALAELNLGRGPQAFFDAYEAAAEADQPRIVDEYLDSLAAVDPELVELKYRFGEIRHATDAAMDLGQALVGLGQEARDPEARQALYEQAKTTFVSVGEFAGSEDDYLLSLGRVNYWLGQREEGKKQFDALLENNGREPGALYRVAANLRELGETGHARELLDEAYAKAPEPAQRFYIASLRARVALELEEERLWLGRSDPALSSTKAQIASVEAQIAERDGKTGEAIAAYRRAIAIYDADEESDSHANNSSIVFYRVFLLGGDLDDYRESVKRMQRAAELNSQSAIVSLNAGRTSLNAAVTESLADEIDFALIATDGGLNMLSYLYDDQASRKAISQRILGTSLAKDALRLTRRGMLLQPSSTSAYSDLLAIAWMTDDAALTSDIEARIDDVVIDHSDALETRARFLAGEQDDTRLKTLRQQIGSVRSRLPAVDERGNALTQAYIRTQLAYLQTQLAQYGVAVDLDEAVRLSQEAEQLAPSVGTKVNLTRALASRGIERLAAANPEFAQVVAPRRRFARGMDLVALVLAQAPQSAGLIVASDDVTRAVALRKALLEGDGRFSDGGDWIVFRHFDEAFATVLAERIYTDTFFQTQAELAARLASHDYLKVSKLAWIYEALGRGDDASRLRAQSEAPNGGLIPAL